MGHVKKDLIDYLIEDALEKFVWSKVDERMECKNDDTSTTD